MAPKKKSDPRKQYFDAIRTGKMDTLRWCLRHGGISVRAENDDGETGIQIAAANGYSEAMQTLIENVRKVGQPADLEETDDEGRTPLMLAALNGKLECARLLVVEGKVKLATKCDHGKTARMYAESRKHDKVVAFLDNPKAPIEESQDEESEDEEEKQKRIFKASQRAANQSTAAAQQEAVHKQRVEAAEALEKALASSAPPVWPEVAPILKETRRELSIRNKPPLDSPSGVIDPAVWNCICLFDLRLEIAERALTSLPPQLSRLSELVTLIVSNNALATLPDEIGKLSKLRNLEAAGNELIALPKTLAEVTGLQVIDVSSNKLTDIAPLATLEGLVAVNAGHNEISDLPLAWGKLEHMQTLSCPHNRIVTMPPGLGHLQMLVSLDLSANKIEQVRPPAAVAAFASTRLPAFHARCIG